MTTYVPQTGDVIAPGSIAQTELLSKVGGFIAGCGQAALAVIIGAVNGIDVSSNTVTSLIQQSITQHLTVGPKASSGQISPSGLKQIASQQGVTLTDMSVEQAIAQYAGTKDIIVGVNNATVFGGNDMPVQGHYITIVGKTATGDLIVSDPNTDESTQGKFVVYTAKQITDAQPFWAAIAEEAQRATSGITNPLDIAAQLSRLNTTFSNFGGTFSRVNTLIDNAKDWLDIRRILKFVMGSALILVALQLTITTRYAPDILTAAGLPDVGNAVRAFTKNTGRQAAIKGGEARITRETREAKQKGVETGVAQQKGAEVAKHSAAGKLGHARRREREQAEREAQATKPALPQLPKPSGISTAYFRRPTRGPRAPVMPQQRAQVQHAKQERERNIGQMRSTLGKASQTGVGRPEKFVDEEEKK